MDQSLVTVFLVALLQYAAAQTDDFCKNLLDGNYANPYNCEKYIACSGQQTIHMWCPIGLQFNEKTDQCDHPGTVNCKPKPRPVPTTAAPTFPICAQATQPGLYPDPQICTKYYRCDGKGNGKELNCPPKTNFHPGYTICVWEGTFTCQGQNFCQGKKDGNYQNNGDCSKFYSCSGELSYIMDCPTGLYYDETRDECDLPENVNCTSTTLPPKPVPTQDPTIPHKSTAAPTSKPATQFCVGKDARHFADAVDCTKFYVCDGYGKGREEKCPPKQNFFPNLGVCVWAYTYSCKANNFCLRKQDGNYANPNNCGTFYACANGLTHLMKCPKNLHYNQAIDRCDYPNKVSCSGRPTVVPPAPKTSVPRATNVPDQDATFCMGKQNGDYQNLKDCASFYKCSNNITYVIKCPSGLWFNPVNDTCDYPKNVICGPATLNNKREVLLDMLDRQFADPEPPSPILCKGRNAGSYQDPLSCQKFVVCDGSGKGVVKKCPKHTNYHPKYRICVWAYIYSCSDPNFCADKKDGNYKNENNCFSYYACSGKLTYSMNCPKGLHFDGKDCINSGKFECN